MSTTTEAEVDLTFRTSRGGVWVRPMFEVLPEFADALVSHDAARWPVPFPIDDLDPDEWEA